MCQISWWSGLMITRMVELLLKGQTYVDTRQCKNNITSLAECLQIRLENIETQSKGEGKLRLRNLSEIMKPGFGLNNNSKVTGTADDIKDHAEEIRKQDDDGWMSKPQYKCLYCGKGFEDVVLRNSNDTSNFAPAIPTSTHHHRSQGLWLTHLRQ